MKKSNKAKLNAVIRTRVTSETEKMLKAKASRENLDMATVIREIILQHFEDNLSDAKIITQYMMKTKNKITSLENKIEIMALLVMELAQMYTRTFPDKQIPESISEKFYEELITKLSANMKNHRGKLESMVLDIYEKSGGE
ncbi:MAG: hypothetical protein NC041_06930 [Bacteroides sp.]|nr:hypothetical protein [Prevotella sp.]MCM1407030.1 hypothetical protein [Treponema brennaborense]MCM1470182.1 hypothetical protein [Bacteroides sp.]